MYFTRFWINRARRGSRKLIGSPHAMHAAVMAGFVDPPQPGGDRSRPLWRVDELPGSRIALYVVSADAPDLTHLVEQAGWPTTSKWETIHYGLLERLESDQTWAFRLTANPVHNVRPDGADRSKRVGHVTVEQQRGWLIQRAERCGFELCRTDGGEPDLIVHGRSTRVFKRNGASVTLRTATYDGRMRVTDAAALRRTLTVGLGHAKAYGCGLLTLAPVR